MTPERWQKVEGMIYHAALEPLFLVFGLLLSRIIAATMTFSSVPVIANALRLHHLPL